MVLTRSGGPLSRVSIEHLPPEILERVFRHFLYKDVAKMRVVSKHMNEVIKSYLTHSFQQTIMIAGKESQILKSILPRRESVRRKHKLSNKFFILDAVHRRLFSLQHTMEYALANNLYFFFAAEVLDEAQRLLDYVASGGDQSYYKIMDEMYDLTTMAHDHYKDEILPKLRIMRGLPEFVCNFSAPIICEPEPLPIVPTISTISKRSTISTEPKPEHPEMKKTVRKLLKAMKRKKKELAELKHSYKKVSKIVGDQGKQLAAMSVRVEEAEKKSADLTAKIAVMEQEVVKCKSSMQEKQSDAVDSGNATENSNESLKRKRSAKMESGNKKPLMRK